MQPPVVQEATGSNGTRLNSLTRVFCAPCKESCNCTHTGEAQGGRLKTWVAGLEAELSPAMSKLHFPASFPLGKCRVVGGTRLCINTVLPCPETGFAKQNLLVKYPIN